MAVQIFRSKGPLRLRVKTQKAEVQSYRADGKPVYSQKPIYAEFSDGIIMLNTEIKEQKEMIESLRKHKSLGTRFEEVSPNKKNDGEARPVAKISLATLRAMNKQDLLALCDTYKLKGVNSDTDTKDEIVKAIQLYYDAN